MPEDAEARFHRAWHRLQEAFGQELAHRNPGGRPWWPGSAWEVCMGAILVQNTRWENVRRVLERLKGMGPEEIAALPLEELAALVRPSGLARQKARRLQALARLVLRFGGLEPFLGRVRREELLGLEGVGEETADVILLYGAERPALPISAYARRILRRLDIPPRRLRELAPLEVRQLQLLHAALVELGKRFCRARPRCDGCPLRDLPCAYAASMRPAGGR